jgi:hypothetical protein
MARRVSRVDDLLKLCALVNVLRLDCSSDSTILSELVQLHERESCLILGTLNLFSIDMHHKSQNTVANKQGKLPGSTLGCEPLGHVIGMSKGQLE